MVQMYPELHRIACRHLGADGAGHTLQPTALVNEAYLKLAAHAGVEVRDRAHFAALLSRIMRQILVDHARRRLAEQRGGGRERISISGLADVADAMDYDVLALDEALQELATLSPTKARLVELRFFAGMTLDETAQVLGVSPSTVVRQWRTARAWLQGALDDVGGDGP
jgi:RNA polymerase sigma factor (TIGR02999 family)